MPHLVAAENREDRQAVPEAVQIEERLSNESRLASGRRRTLGSLVDARREVDA